MKTANAFNYLVLLLFTALIYPQIERPENFFKNRDGKIIPAGKENIGSRNLFDNAVKEEKLNYYYSEMSKKSNNDMTFIDSVIVTDNSGAKIKHTYFYDTNGNKTSQLYETKSGGQFVNVNRYTFTYDANGNITSEIGEIWTEDQWENNWRYTYTYSENGNITSRLNEVWSDGQWISSNRSTCTFDINGNITSELKEMYSSEQWVNDTRETYTYDANGNMTSELIELWDWQSGGHWAENQFFSYTYDANGNLTVKLFELWSLGQRLNGSRDSYSYDANGNEIMHLREDWQESKWENWYRETSAYDTDGNMILWLCEDWIDSNWVNSWRFLYTYNSNGKMTSEIDEEWVDDQWVNANSYTYNYNAEGNIVSGINEIWEAGSWIPLNTLFVIEGTYYGFGSEIDFYYNVNTVDVASNSEMVNDFSLSQNYPNPFNPSTIIRFSLPAGRQELPMNSFVTLKVYNLLGQEVATLVNEQKPAGNYEVKFDASSLASGVYVYRLNAGDFTASQKMLLLK